MNSNILVFDNFYNNADEVREHVLTLDFNILGNYPGRRTIPEPADQKEYLKSFLETNILHKEITFWPNEYNTSYQYTLENDETWIHHDDTEWAGVLYLTPNAPYESGTGFYRNIETGIERWNKEDEIDYNNLDEVRDLSKWEQIAFIGNVYNRLVLYRGYSYHRSVLPGFGKTKETGRLFQTFFFNT